MFSPLQSETPDSSLANSPARDLSANGASTSAPASPAGKTMKDTSSPAVKRRDKKRGTFLRGIGARVSRIFGTQPPRSPTSPARLDHETAQPRVPVITTSDGEVDEKPAVTTTVEKEERIPDVVTNEDIIKMLDFVSETTEQAVYKTVEIRGRISSVDEAKSKQELRNAYRSLRKAENALKGTMDDLTKVEEALKSAPEVIPDKAQSAADDKPAVTVPVPAAPIAVDELAQEENTHSDPKDSKTIESDINVDGEKCEALNESLDTVEDFEERKASVSLMEAIQKTLNGKHRAISMSTGGKVEEEEEASTQIDTDNKGEGDDGTTPKEENEVKESTDTGNEEQEPTNNENEQKAAEDKVNEKKVNEEKESKDKETDEKETTDKANEEKETKDKDTEETMGHDKTSQEEGTNEDERPKEEEKEKGEDKSETVPPEKQETTEKESEGTDTQ